MNLGIAGRSALVLQLVAFLASTGAAYIRALSCALTAALSRAFKRVPRSSASRGSRPRTRHVYAEPGPADGIIAAGRELIGYDSTMAIKYPVFQRGLVPTIRKAPQASVGSEHRPLACR